VGWDQDPCQCRADGQCRVEIITKPFCGDLVSSPIICPRAAPATSAGSLFTCSDVSQRHFPGRLARGQSTWPVPSQRRHTVTIPPSRSPPRDSSRLPFTRTGVTRHQLQFTMTGVTRRRRSTTTNGLGLTSRREPYRTMMTPSKGYWGCR
jgi:hypothetical protein